MAGKFHIGLFFIGVGLGMALPSLPKELAFLNPYLWIVFIVIGILLIIKGS
jgi:Kef-type K+ transport system membrane component KefB